MQLAKFCYLRFALAVLGTMICCISFAQDLEIEIEEIVYDSVWKVGFLMNDGFPPYSVFVHYEDGQEVTEFFIRKAFEWSEFKVYKSGYYRVTINDFLCGVLTHSFEIQSKTPNQESELFLYPNPVNGSASVRIIGPKLKNSIIEIYNESGSLVLKKEIVKGSECSINVIEFHKGFYVIKVIHASGEITVKKLMID